MQGGRADGTSQVAWPSAVFPIYTLPDYRLQPPLLTKLELFHTKYFFLCEVLIIKSGCLFGEITD